MELEADAIWHHIEIKQLIGKKQMEKSVAVINYIYSVHVSILRRRSSILHALMELEADAICRHIGSVAASGTCLAADREIFSISYSIKLKSDCIYHFTIDLARYRRPFGAKSIGKW